MKKLLNKNISFILMIISWLALIWCRTFVELTGYSGGAEFWGVFLSSGLAVLATLFYGSIFIFRDGDGAWLDLVEYDDVDEDDLEYEFGESEDADDLGYEFGKSEDADDLGYEFDEINDEDDWWDDFKGEAFSPGLRKSLCIMLCLAGICMFSFIFQNWSYGLDLFSSPTDMTIAFLTINKKYAYDVIMMIIFPLWSAYILKKIRKSSFSGWAVFSGGVQILVLTLIECMLYMESSNIWRVELAFVNIITLILGYRIYIWDKVQKKGNAVVLLIGYGLFWGLLLSMFHYSGESAVEYMAGVLRWDFSSPDSYISNVKTLVENAAYIGQSNNLLMDSYILDFLYESPNPIMSALFHGGWIAAIAVIVLEIVFAAAAGVLVLRKGKKQRMFDIVLYIAWLSLAIRVVAGILYTFGVPIPILLPFTSTVGIRMDSMAMGILILGYLIETLQGFFNKVLDDMIEDIVEDVEEPDDIEEPEEPEEAEKTKDTEDTEEAEKAEQTKDTEDTEEPEDTKEAEEAEEPEDTKEAEEAADTADNSSDCEEDADGESKGEV